MNSILTSIKKLLGISEDYTHFDTDIIMHINSAFSVLTQLGIGSEDGFLIEDDTTEWSDFLGTEKGLELVKDYVYLKVKTLFDPPLSASVSDAMQRTLSEFEWRIQAVIETEEEILDE